MNSETKSIDGISVNLVDVFSFIWSKKFICLILLVLSAVAGILYSKFLLVPKYVSRAKMVILETSDTGKISSSEIAISTYLVTDYSEMIVDRTVLEEVIKELKLNLSYEQLKGAVSVDNPENSRILEVSVATSNPAASQKIANMICHIAKAKIVEVLGVDKVNIFSEANLPTGNANFSTRTYAVFGGIIGLVVIFAIACLFSAFDDKIKNNDDVDKYLGLCTLATIPYNSSKKKKRSKFRSRKAENN